MQPLIYSLTDDGEGMPCRESNQSPDRFLSLVCLNALLLLPSLICHAPLAPANRFLPLDAAELALGYKPSLTANSA
jgi:hypothetical protein